MFVVKNKKKKFGEFEDFVLACRSARDLGNGGKQFFVVKNNKELYRTKYC